MFSQADYICPGMRTCDDGPRNWSNRSPVSTKGWRDRSICNILFCTHATKQKHESATLRDAPYEPDESIASAAKRKVSHSLRYPEGFPILGEVTSGGGLCHVPVTCTVSSPATSRWMWLSIGPRKEKLGNDSLLLGRDGPCCCAAGDHCVLSGRRGRQQGRGKTVWESGSLYPSATLKGPGYAPRCELGKAASYSGSFLFQDLSHLWTDLKVFVSVCELDMSVCVCACKCLYWDETEQEHVRKGLSVGRTSSELVRLSARFFSPLNHFL